MTRPAGGPRAVPAGPGDRARAAGLRPAAAGGPGDPARAAPHQPETVPGAGRPASEGAGQGAAQVVVTGYGPRRASARETVLRDQPFGALAVAGMGGGLAADLRPGDLVVATEVTDGHTITACPSAPLLAGELRRAGLGVRAGPVVTVDQLVRGPERERLAATGALVVDLESACWPPRPASGRWRWSGPSPTPRSGRW